MLEIQDIHVVHEGREILSGLNLTVRKGEIHALMGPNGAGKSTLAKVIAGHPDYEVTEGEILFQGLSLLDKEAEERAHLGLFVSFQYPPEISGVSNSQFLFHAMKAKEPTLTREVFEQLLTEKMALVEMRTEFKERSVNEGFSGGEKKRNEILQMALLNPTFALLDETDSGLDIDALRIVAAGVNHLMSQEKGLLLITHYQRLLEYIQPHFVHVLVGGKIRETGDASLAKQLERSGYEHYATL